MLLTLETTEGEATVAGEQNSGLYLPVPFPLLGMTAFCATKLCPVATGEADPDNPASLQRPGRVSYLGTAGIRGWPPAVLGHPGCCGCWQALASACSM